MNRTFNALIPALLGGAIAFPASAQTYTTFDVPGSTSTFGLAIDAAGEIAGAYTDANNVSHGFVRATDGTFTTFDPPLPGGSGVESFAISGAGIVVGDYANTGGFRRAFVRDPNGTIFSLKFPVAPGGFNASATGINSSGVVVGWLQRLSPFSFQGFIRSKDRTITLFNPPAGGNSASPAAVNEAGTITGEYRDAIFVGHGFLRDTQGNFTIFDAPGSTETVPAGISSDGAIGGYYRTNSSGGHGFYRDASASVVSFDPPKSNGTTFVTGVNSAGLVVGWFEFASSTPPNYRSFIRFPSAVIVTFEVPGASFTQAQSINGTGWVTGHYGGADGVPHGFLRKP